MKKLTYDELLNIIYKHNEKNNITSQFEDDNALNCVIVYSASNWTKQYSEASRSYVFTSDNKRFIPSACGGSIFADCLDGSEKYIRLDWVNWAIDYCYIMDK